MRIAALALMIALLAGCAPPIASVQRPADGFRQMRTTDVLELRAGMPGPLSAVDRFAPGTVFSQTHTRVSDGLPLWCTGAGEAFTCLIVERDRVLPRAHIPIAIDWWVERPPGVLEELRR